MKNRITVFAAATTLLLTMTLELCADQRRGGADISKGGYDSLVPWMELGNLKALDGWSGLKKSDAGAILSVPGKARFSYPSGTNWSNYSGLRLNITVPEGRVFEGEIVLSTPDRTGAKGYRSKKSTTKGSFTILGSGKEIIDVPLTAFDHYFPFFDTFDAIQDVVVR